MTVDNRSSDISQIATSSSNIPADSVDCGVLAFGWCNGPRWLRCARLRTFVMALACAGVAQGACEAYFRTSAKEAALEYGFNQIIVEWLLVSSGIFQAIFALAFAHVAYKMHPIKWLSGTIIVQSVICVIAVVPAMIGITDDIAKPKSVVDANLCAITTYQKSVLTAQQTQFSTLILLFVLQFGLGFGALAYYTVGVTYLDDNSPSIDSPAVLSTVLAARVFGLQVGSFVVMGVGATRFGWWLGWIILAPVVLLSGILLGLFPKHLPKTVIHQAAQRIIDGTHTHTLGNQFVTYIDDVGFRATLKRLCTNKLLMCNLLGIMLILSANVNFELQEEAYLQSRFFLPYSEEDGLLQEWEAKFVAYFLRPPVAAMAMLVLGLIIAKLKMSARAITGANIVFGIHLLAIFVGNIFINCDVGEVAGIMNYKLQQPFCSRQCTDVCTATTFRPVCPENSTVTYFSACYAGCSRSTVLNNVQIYEGCSCPSTGLNNQSSVRAIEGACSSVTCQRMLIVFQVMSLLAAAAIGASTIGKVIITLRSVLPQDKAMALAMQLFLFGIFAYLPIRIGYDMVARDNCSYWAPEYKRCLLRFTPIHGNILNIISATLVSMGIICDVLVYIFSKGVNVYNCKIIDPYYSPSLYSPIPHEDPQIAVVQRAMGGSPAAVVANASLAQHTDTQSSHNTLKFLASNIFRNPSSLTNSSAGESSVQENNNSTGVTYAQVVFPPDKHKLHDGDTSPKRMAVRADVPVHYLSSQDVRAQLGNLKSFNSPNKPTSDEVLPAAEETLLMLSKESVHSKVVVVPVMPTDMTTEPTAVVTKPTTTTEKLTTRTTTPTETDLDKIAQVPFRPLSPETDF